LRQGRAQQHIHAVRTSSSVHLTPVADPHNQNAQFAILNLGNDPIIAEAVFPELPQF
jgi:hypothetical protein